MPGRQGAVGSLTADRLHRRYATDSCRGRWPWCAIRMLAPVASFGTSLYPHYTAHASVVWHNRRPWPAP